MATESYQVQLERVQTAIAALENGVQSYKYAGREVTKVNINWLYQREDRLLRLAARETNGGGIRVRLGGAH